MSPERLYWLALVLLVLPSLPYNKVAIAVLTVWAFGHVSHIMGPYEDAAYMVARIIAIGAAMALFRPWDGSRRAYSQLFVALLFFPTAMIAAYSAIYCDDAARTVQEYHVQLGLYWSLWTMIMAQAIAVPFGNDWHKVKSDLRQLDQWLFAKIVKYFGEAL